VTCSVADALSRVETNAIHTTQTLMVDFKDNSTEQQTDPELAQLRDTSYAKAQSHSTVSAEASTNQHSQAAANLHPCVCAA